LIAKIRKCLQNNRGQALVEMALVLPVLLLILAGTIEFGRVLNQYLVVTAAAREGARAAVVGDSDAVVIETVKQSAAAIDKGSMTVSVTPADRSRGSAVTVTVTNPVQIMTPLISAFFPQNPLPVQGQVIMRME
jgi:Flp pilus assembly protein TadG